MVNYNNLTIEQLEKRQEKTHNKIRKLNDDIDIFMASYEKRVADRKLKEEQKDVNAKLTRYERFVKGKPQSDAMKKAKHKYYLKLKAAKLLKNENADEVIE